MSEVNDELATDLEMAERARSLEKAVGKAYDATKRYAQCVECGEDMLPARAATGAPTCIECQELIEKARKRLQR
jgi:RNA polymerase-binding transcription factor DksA